MFSCRTKRMGRIRRPPVCVGERAKAFGLVEVESNIALCVNALYSLEYLLYAVKTEKLVPPKTLHKIYIQLNQPAAPLSPLTVLQNMTPLNYKSMIFNAREEGRVH